MREVAAIGSREAVLAFHALGIEAVPVCSDDEARAALHALARRGCAVIFVADDIHARIPDAVARYNSTPLPAVIPIPCGGAGGGRWGQPQTPPGTEPLDPSSPAGG